MARAPPSAAAHVSVAPPGCSVGPEGTRCSVLYHLRRFESEGSAMSPRLTDWSLALAAGVAFGSGVVSLVSGRPELWLVFALRGMAGLWLLLLLWRKFARVLPRLLRPRLWDRATLFGAVAALVVALALGSGIWWVFGGDLYVAGF